LSTKIFKKCLKNFGTFLKIFQLCSTPSQAATGMSIVQVQEKMPFLMYISVSFVVDAFVGVSNGVIVFYCYYGTM
jgi:hypothetical protein